VLTIEREGEAIKLSGEKIEGVLQWALQSPEIRPVVKASIYASLWLASVQQFRQQEDEALANGTYETRLADHRYTLSILMTRGEGVMLMVNENGLLPNAPFSKDDLSATLQSLYDTFRGQHQNSNSKQTDQEIAKLLNGS
jgi:hypothetical protein